jgi:DNA-binding transcriptional LysR family regulator
MATLMANISGYVTAVEKNEYMKRAPPRTRGDTACSNCAATGELRLGTINTALHSLLPDILARFVTAHPHVKVFIQSGTSNELYEALRQGDVDAAVCTHPAFAMPKTFVWELLREEPLVVIAPQSLAQRDAHDLLAHEPLIRYDRSLAGGKEAERYLRRVGIVPNERFELSSLAAIAMMVDRGLGVSLARGCRVANDQRPADRADQLADGVGAAPLRRALETGVSA